MIFRFGTMEFDTRLMELRRDGVPAPMEPQAFRLLRLLIENRDRVVSKDELIDIVWDGRIVSEATVSSCINAVRRAVGDDGKRQDVIRTLPRRGFRFVQSVEIPDERPSPSVGAAATFLPDRPSVAVLPFRNIPSNPDEDYFADGVTEDLITELSKFSGLFVIARMSSFAFKGQDPDAREASRALGVRYLLEGSIRRLGRTVRINAQLIDGAMGNHVWAERYDGRQEDIFDFLDRIVEQIIAATAISLTKTEQENALRKPTENLNAYDLVLRGTYFHHRYTKADNAKARELFERAIELDPAYAEAYACLGWTHVHDFNFGWSDEPARSLRLAEEQSKKAVDLNGGLAKAHMVLGDAYVWQGRVDDAYAEGKRAVDLNPNYADAHFLFSWYSAWAGKVNEAVAAAQKALRLDPKSSFFGYYFVLGHAYFLDQSFDAAAEHLEQSVRFEAGAWFPRLWLIATYGQMGRNDAALSHFAELAKIRELSTASFEDIKALLPDALRYKNPEHQWLFDEGLRKAGALG